MAMSTAVAHTLYITGLFAELGFKPNGSTPILCDGGAACTISQVEHYDGRTRHIAVRMAHLMESSGRGEKSVVLTSVKKQKADMYANKSTISHDTKESY